MLKLAFFLPNTLGYQDRIKVLKELSWEDIDVTLIIGSMDKYILSEGYDNFRIVSAEFVSGFRILNLIKSYWILRKLHKTHKFDLVHDTFGNFLIYFLTTFRNSKRPVYISSFYALEKWRIENIWKPSGHNRLELLFRRSTRRTFMGELIQSIMGKICDYIVVQAPGLVERLLLYENLPHRKVKVLTNSVDVNYWKPVCNPDKSPPCSNEIRKILYIPQRSMDGIDASLGMKTVLE